jgi:hypothetical protein
LVSLALNSTVPGILTGASMLADRSAAVSCSSYAMLRRSWVASSIGIGGYALSSLSCGVLAPNRMVATGCR